MPKPDAYELNINWPMVMPDRVLWIVKAGAIFKPFGDGNDYRHEESGAILMRSVVDLAPHWFTPLYNSPKA